MVEPFIFVDMERKPITELVKQTALLTGETSESVDSVTSFVAHFTADTIRSGELKNVRWPLLGLFKVNNKRLNMLAKHSFIVKPDAEIKPDE